MITVLTVVEDKASSFFKRIGKYLKGNEIKTLSKTKEGITVVHIKYYQRRNKIDWEKIKEQAGYERKSLLCSSSLRPPAYVGITRYKGNSLQRRLAENASLTVLNRMGKERQKIEVGLYDPKGRYGDLVEDLLQYTNKLTIVTDKDLFYKEVHSDIMDRYGASFLIQNHVNRLSSCQLIIAPDKIEKRLPVSSGAVVFTGEEPAVGLQGLVFDRYEFALAQKYKSIKPGELSDAYFAQALYDKEKQYELGQVVPDMCKRNGMGSTIQEICTILRIHSKKT